MKYRTRARAFAAAICLGLSALVLGGAAQAQHTGGGGHVGAVSRAAGYRGGYGGQYGGYGGYHGGYYGGYGWRGGYGWHGYGGWGWGWDGLGLGLYLAALPLYYSTLWWEGVPYYYADNTYYRWDGGVGRYRTVAPPPALQGQLAGESAAYDFIAYPKNAQSSEQQATDKYECHHWAVTQTGFDPTLGGGPQAGSRADYLRAQASCLEGRGYSVK